MALVPGSLRDSHLWGVKAVFGEVGSAAEKGWANVKKTIVELDFLIYKWNRL